MSPLRAVFGKELLDAVRDRRSMLSMLLFPLFGPLVVSLMLTQLIERQSRDQPVTVPIQGKEHAPGLVAELERLGATVVDPPADPEDAVREGKVALVLIVPPDYGQKFRAGVSARLQFMVDSSRQETRYTVRRVEKWLKTYNASTGALRLLARGVSPEMAQPITVSELDLATPQKQAGAFLNLIPMFVLLAAFMGGMYVATDATAGERERGSLEPLLITPVSRTSLVVGKWGAAVMFSMVCVALTLAFSVLALSMVPADKLGLNLTLGKSEIVGLTVATLPLSLAATGLQILVATFARSFKEAQTYLSLMMLTPMLPAFYFIINPGKSESWMAAIPVLGQQALLTDVVRGEAVSGLALGLAALSSLVVGLLCVYAAAVLFRKESIIFGR